MVVSKQFIDAQDDDFQATQFSKSTNSLPAPPNSRRRLVLLGLFVIGSLACAVSFLLSPAAVYSLQGGSPHELHSLSNANLSEAPQWVHASGSPSPTALSFQRRGRAGSFHLTQDSSRKEVWLVLRLPSPLSAGDDHSLPYVPPSHFTGRLLKADAAGLMYAPIVKLIEDQGQKLDGQYLLLDGETPRQQRDSLFAALLLAFIGIACLSFGANLALRNP